MAEAETEDRTQAPSNRRRQEARERGQAAYSPELSGAAGLLAASAALWVWGDGLAASLAVGRPRAADGGGPRLGRRRRGRRAPPRRWRSAWPGRSAWSLGAFALAAFAAHLAQTRGLWAPALLAPDPSRLWAVGQGGGFADRAARGPGDWPRRRSSWRSPPGWSAPTGSPSTASAGSTPPTSPAPSGRSLRHLLLDPLRRHAGARA